MSWRLVVSGAVLCGAIAFFPRFVSAQAAPRLCSGGVDDGVACTSDADCRAAVCVIAQGLCDGGTQSGQTCDQSCDSGTCVLTQRICTAGGNVGLFCLRDIDCGIPTACRSTGLKCSGGSLVDLPCTTATDCNGAPCSGFQPTAVPTQTPTSTPTPTPSVTLTATPSATPVRSASATNTIGPTSTATATPRVVRLSVTSASAGPGSAIALAVRIETSGAEIVATANDISFDSSFASIDPASCRINSRLAKTLHASLVAQDGSRRTLRVLVEAAQDLTPIPDGLLYTCTARIAASALPNTYRIQNAPAIAYDAGGMPYEHVEALSGFITVSLIGGACTGDCSGDGDVTVDEIIAGVNIALGSRSVDECLSLDANGDGEITIDELIAAVNNALLGCVTAPTPIPTVTPTATAVPTTIYVRSGGSDADSGSTAARALRTISFATSLARSGYRIVVGPGTYAESVVTSTSGGAPQHLIFVADVDGSLTGDPPGAVIVDAQGTASGTGFRFSNSSDTAVDGFTITNANDAAVLIRGGSNGVMVKNCELHDNPGAGVRVQDSSDALIFNNLIHNNGAQGVAIVGNGAGSPRARIFSNTIASNGDRGITIGTTNAASPNALVLNNVLQDNGLRSSPPLDNIKVFTSPSSDAGYNGDYNLVFPPTYLPAFIAGDHDVAADAAFVFAPGDDYHLRADSPALNAGTMLPLDLEAELYRRTTLGGATDTGRLDLGFHFLP